MEGLIGFSAVRLVVIHWCDLSGSSHFQMGNIATRVPTPRGLFQLAVPTRIQFLLSDHLSSLPVKLSGCIFASLVKGHSFTSPFNFLFFHSPYLNCSLLWFCRPSPLFALSHLNKVSWFLSLEKEFGFDIYVNPPALLLPLRVELMKCISEKADCIMHVKSWRGKYRDLELEQTTTVIKICQLASQKFAMLPLKVIYISCLQWSYCRVLQNLTTCFLTSWQKLFKLFEVM